MGWTLNLIPAKRYIQYFSIRLRISRKLDFFQTLHGLKRCERLFTSWEFRNIINTLCMNTCIDQPRHKEHSCKRSWRLVDELGRSRVSERHNMDEMPNGRPRTEIALLGQGLDYLPWQSSLYLFLPNKLLWVRYINFFIMMI